MNLGSQNHGIKDGGISFDATRDTMTRQGKHSQQINRNASKKASEVLQANAQALQEPTSEVEKDVLINDRKQFGCDVGEEDNNDLGYYKKIQQNDDKDDKMLCRGSRVEDASTPIYIDSDQTLETLEAADHETEGDEDRPNRDLLTKQRIPDSQTRTEGANHDTKGKANTNRSNPSANKIRQFFYKAVASIPTSPQLFRRRRRRGSMFEIKPAEEVVEIRDICIENGAVQTVKESALSLPELTANGKDGRRKSSDHDRSRRRIAEAASDYGSAPHERIRSRKITPGDISKLLNGNTWTSPVSKTNTKAVQSCPSTPLASPRVRRRSLGVLTTAAWGVSIYRDKDAVETMHPSPRRRSLKSSDENLLQNSKKPSWVNQRKNSSDETQGGMSKLSNEFITIRQKQQDTEENKNKLQGKCQTNAQEQISKQEIRTNPDKNWEESRPQLCSEIDVKELTCERKNETRPDVKLDTFRPRLRSRSLEDHRLVARQRVLQGRGNDKRIDTRRKSFDIWLSDKEKQTMQKLNTLALEKQREAEKEARKSRARKGKTYDEWLNDKATIETKRRASLVTLSDTREEANERQRIARNRYENWLLEKETQSLEKERRMVKEAERKTMEMRKKYEEKKKNLMNEGKYSTGSVCG